MKAPTANADLFKKVSRGQSPDYADKKQFVLETAARLFEERGYQATSILDIAKELNVTKPTLYWYFQNKEDILSNILEAAEEQIRLDLCEAVDHDGTARERLEIVIRSLARNSSSLFGKVIIKTTLSQISSDVQQKFGGHYKNSYRTVRKIISDGIKDGSLAGMNVEMAAFVLLGAVNWMAFWFSEHGSMEPQEVATHMIAVLENGFLPR